MVYVRADALPALKDYKYQGVDHSLLSRYVLKPFYEWLIQFFPLWMAPNLITLLGFTFVVVNMVTLLYFNPSLDQDTNLPPWVYASWSISLLIYQTLDALDGKQARRTKQSGPLGELFDHGVDAVNTSLECLLFAAAVNLGRWQTVATLFASLLTFYTQTWDEYHTHQLTLGVVSGPVEGILIIVVVYAFTAWVGGATFWSQSMLQTLGVPKTALIPRFIYDMPFNQWYMAQGCVVLVLNTVWSSMNVIKARRDRGDKSRYALVGLLPFFLTWTLIPIYLLLNPIILQEHLVPFVFVAGLINAYSVGQMITAHLVKLPFPYYNILNIPLAYGVLDSLGPFLQRWVGVGWPTALGDDMYQVAYMFSMLGLSLGVYGSFVYDVIITLCDELDIWCLTIKHPDGSGREKSKAGADTRTAKKDL